MAAYRYYYFMGFWLFAVFSSMAMPQKNLDIVYAKPDGQALRLDLYLPEKTSLPVPVVLWIHGGGWRVGTKADCPWSRFVDAGFAVASMEYRLAPKFIFPAQIQDAKAAVRFLRAHAKEYNLNVHQIAAVGASAGGQLATLLALSISHPEWEVGENLDQPSSVNAVVSIFGAVDLHNTLEQSADQKQLFDCVCDFLGVHTWRSIPEIARVASGFDVLDNLAVGGACVSYGRAPFLILHGDKDMMVPVRHSTKLHEKLQKAAFKSTLKIIPGAGHSYGPPYGDAFIGQAAQFLKENWP